jgi:predicted unusual protein kinase regulating ubiquinone biosynthesis (AarF/ABC1/UbiB family)
MNGFLYTFLIDFYRFSRFLYGLYKLIGNETEQNINSIKKYANQCGALAIKLLQFLCMNYIIKTEELKIFFEQCTIHTIEETKKMYLEDFGEDIEKTFILHEVIGSGSIGQVYRAYNIEKGVYTALKVKHPGIENEVLQFIKITNVFLFLFQWVLPFAYIISEYIYCIELQLDYSLEAKNTMVLKQKFKKEESIVIPEIYFNSEHFISMSYHEGISFDKITDKKTRMRVSVYMNFVTMSFLLLYDIFHGDLHYGNWKVDISSENKLKIILYDCGLVYSSGDLEFNKKMVEYISKNDYYSLLYTINPDKNKKDIKNIIDRIQTKILNVPTSKRIKVFLSEAIKHKLLRDKTTVHILNAYAIVCETLFVSIEKLNTFVYRKDDIAILFSIYHELLNNMGIFQELNVFIKTWMDSDPQNKEIFTKWLMDEFGHIDSKIIGSILHNKLI